MTPGPRDRLIGSAISLVRARGVEGTGVAELLEHSGTARRSLYQHFPGGKNELIAASTRAAGSWMRRALRELGDRGSVASTIQPMIEQIVQNLAANDYTLRCPIAAAAGAAPEAVAIREAAANAFESWTETLTAALVAEGRPNAEARSLAGFMVSSIEGALMRAGSSQSPEPLEQAAHHLGVLLGLRSP